MNEKLKYILYARKSSEAEDRQVASIESQLDELNALAKKLGITVIDQMTESKSAKQPGRPVFNEMLERINRGEAQGILCWKLDRLARNPIDGGQISWMLQQSILKHIQTHERSYIPSDNVLMMSFELGIANQFIRDLSSNVKRGFRNKVKEGWITGMAPSGYINTPDREKGQKVIEKDPDRFNLVRKMWDMMLTGNFTVMQILMTANKQWGYRTIKRKKEGGRPLSRSAIYKIFTNPFYYGEFEFPQGSGNWYKGSHKPMISKAEFQRVQALLGSKGRPAPHTREFAFTGPIMCGECGCQITAEAKNQMICSECKYKFAYENKNNCPKCHCAIEEMKNPKILNYVYYHCTKRKDPNCTQKSIKVDDLENQISNYLSTITINQRYLDWGIEHLKKTHQVEIETRNDVLASQEKTYHDIMSKLDKLVDLRLNDEINETEFALKKDWLTKEKEKYLGLIGESNKRQNDWIKSAEKTLTFSHYAKQWFDEAREKKDLRKQREILTTLGQNLILKDGKLNIYAAEPFKLIEKAVAEIPTATEMLEPAFHAVDKRKKTTLESDRLSWLSSRVTVTPFKGFPATLERYAQALGSWVYGAQFRNSLTHHEEMGHFGTVLRS